MSKITNGQTSSKTYYCQSRPVRCDVGSIRESVDEQPRAQTIGSVLQKANIGIHGVMDESHTVAKGCCSVSSGWHFETLGAVNDQIAHNKLDLPQAPSNLGETQTENPPDMWETQTGNTSGPRRRRKKQKRRKTYTPTPSPPLLRKFPRCTTS
ncbi:hypothetical protein RHMOL_Rhmol09G0161200 [Rhododendron molle]|uniref:Uncharacterized protein n=1 Tax=Rhododendron molle TaxID=49168 RepID=A0ACC0MDP0_RHOML|nr:hypothetical protein RHMOL_Rhmol09G0161200 [Rhododendron molle]